MSRNGRLLFEVAHSLSGRSSAQRRYELTLWERAGGLPSYREVRDLERYRVERTGACPWAGWVHTDGRAAVLLADDELMFLRKDGSTCGTTSVLRELQRTRCHHIRHSTAGMLWTYHPIGYWIEARGL
jgi:hypothetical protein